MPEFENSSLSDELIDQSKKWNSHQWGLAKFVVGLKPEERAEWKIRFEALEERLKNKEHLYPYTQLPFFNMCLGLSQDELSELSKRAPKDLIKRTEENAPFTPFDLKD